MELCLCDLLDSNVIFFSKRFSNPGSEIACLIGKNRRKGEIGLSD